jgi:ubiquinone/menaquinone biosynthesis C-methylase UbiE
MSTEHTPPLASAEEAIYYHNDIFGSRLLVRILQQHLAGTALEVGAGGGAVTRALSTHCTSVTALEPNKELHSTLAQTTSDLSNVTTRNEFLQSYVQSLAGKPSDQRQGFDAIVYINVLEHIADDLAELSLATSVLKPDGRVLIVVPAHQWLYAKVDRLTGHHRRYSKRGLQSAITRSGLRVETIRYFDTVGLLPYYLIYKLLRSTSTAGTNAVIYSRIIMPISYLLYRFSNGRLVGKNLVAVAKLPS